MSHPSKKCSRCHQAKPLGEFKSDSRKPDGKASSCKACNTAVGYASFGQMSELGLYDQARALLAKAKAVDEVKTIADKAAALKEYARRAGDRTLEIDATEIRFFAERRMGEMLIAQKETIGLNTGTRGQLKGRNASGTTEKEAPEDDRPTLAEVGISYKLSTHAQKLASVPEHEFQARVDAWRDEMSAGQTRVTMDLMRIGEAAINGARSVMGSRQEPDDSLDYFCTPPWATRALVEHVLPHLERGGHCKWQTVWEPACGEGHMAEVLGEYFKTVCSTDIHDYGYGAHRIDFLDTTPDIQPSFDWVITNPPFGELGEAFVLKALDLVGTGVAMFMRVQWLDTIGRYENIFKPCPPTLIAFFAERVNLCKGRWDPEGSTATAYMWLVWLKGAEPRAPFWIPPGCRESLARSDDVERFTAHPVKRNTNPPSQRTEVAGPNGKAQCPTLPGCEDVDESQQRSRDLSNEDEAA